MESKVLAARVDMEFYHRVEVLTNGDISSFVRTAVEEYVIKLEQSDKPIVIPQEIMDTFEKMMDDRFQKHGGILQQVTQGDSTSRESISFSNAGGRPRRVHLDYSEPSGDILNSNEPVMDKPVTRLSDEG